MAEPESVERMRARQGLCASGEWKIEAGKDCPKCGAGPRDECGPARRAEREELLSLRAQLTAESARADAAEQAGYERGVREAAEIARKASGQFNDRVVSTLSGDDMAPFLGGIASDIERDMLALLTSTAAKEEKAP